MLFYRRQKNALTILLYHGVAPYNSTGIYNYREKFIEPEQFKKQIAYLSKHYTILTLDQAIKLLAEDKSLPPYSLVITFDDGYRNFYDYAYPTLLKDTLPATIFIVTDFIDKKIPLWMDRLEYAVGLSGNKQFKSRSDRTSYDKNVREKMKHLPDNDKQALLSSIENELGVKLESTDLEKSLYAPLSWDQIKEMKTHSITIGAHTKSHPILTLLPHFKMEEEIKESKKVLEEHIGVISRTFSYPNGQLGDFNEETKKVVLESRFVAALSTLPGTNQKTDDLFSLKRFTVDGTGGLAMFIVTITGTRSFFQNIQNYAKRSHLF